MPRARHPVTAPHSTSVTSPHPGAQVRCSAAPTVALSTSTPRSAAEADTSPAITRASAAFGADGSRPHRVRSCCDCLGHRSFDRGCPVAHRIRVVACSGAMPAGTRSSASRAPCRPNRCMMPPCPPSPVDAVVFQSNPICASRARRGARTAIISCSSVIGSTVRGHQAPSIDPVAVSCSRSTIRLHPSDDLSASVSFGCDDVTQRARGSGVRRSRYHQCRPATCKRCVIDAL